MRTVLLLLLVVCLGTLCQAQEKPLTFKVLPVTMPIAHTLEQSAFWIQDSQIAASFFKVKHGRVKRALSFRPKTKKTQVA